MQWRKLGRILDPAQSGVSWMRTHAALPVAANLQGDRFRVYCAGRDGEGRAQIGAVEIAVGENPALLGIEPEPLLSYGELGAFDDRGVLPASIVTMPGRLLLYYTGVMLGVTVPFYYAVGAAQSTDGGRSWRRLSQAPVLDRNDADPLLTASPFVMTEGTSWRMWYTSGVRWVQENGAPKHYYLIKNADSADGLHWNRAGRIAVDFENGDYAISRPCVLKDGPLYRMWFAHRGTGYRIGYAESPDGLTWERGPEPQGIGTSASGWDDEMICYPYVFDHEGRRYMLYNGNSFGRTGFGIAVLEQ